MFLTIVVGSIGVAIFFVLHTYNSYWKRRGVRQLTPWPIIGNMGPIVVRNREVSHITQDIYNSYPNSRYVGIYQFRKPTLFVRDPELIRQITIKNYTHFPEHSLFNNDENDVPKNKGLFSLGAKSGWSDMRKKLNGGFTPGKMREMFELIDQATDSLINHLRAEEGSEVDTKDLFTRLNCNIIASTMFGITCDCLKDSDYPLFLIGNQVNDYSSWKFVRIFPTAISMTLTKMLNISLVTQEIFMFFMEIIKYSLNERKRTLRYRADMIDFMLGNKGEVNEDYSSKQRANLNDDEMAMQLFGFFIGGYDAISALLAYSVYELAVNRDIQQKLRREVDDMTETEFNYETLMNMKYLDMVISEVLRKWPIAVFIDRKCTEQYVIPPEGDGERELILEPGTLCWIPIYAIHRDPKYYPDPEKFDPERFSEENKHQINRSVYFPFGAGPRTCIASKFSVYVSKLVLVRILQSYQIVKSEGTRAPSDVSKIVIFLSGSGSKVAFIERP